MTDAKKGRTLSTWVSEEVYLALEEKARVAERTVSFIAQKILSQGLKDLRKKKKISTQV